MAEGLLGALLLLLVAAFGFLSYLRGFRRGMKIGAAITIKKVNAELSMLPVRGKVKQFGVGFDR